MKVITRLEGEEVTITIEPESDIEMLIVRQMNVINASRLNGNIVLVKERAPVHEVHRFNPPEQRQ